MEHETTQEEQGGAPRSNAPGRPFTSETARAAARAGVASRRAKQAAREADAEFERLAVSARVSTVLAGRLTREKLERLIDSLLDAATAGGAVGMQAHTRLQGWLKLALGDDEPDPDGDTDYASMSPARRAAIRARLLRAMEEEGGVETVEEGLDPEQRA